jgi:methionyl aminopeptidase
MAKKKRNIHYRRGAELDGLREAGALAAEVLRLTAELVRPGVSTGEIDDAAAELIAERSCQSAFLGYRGFPGTICISLNEEVVHGIGSPNRIIQSGDIVKIDVGIVTPDGWVGDNAKTVPAGDLRPDACDLMFATEESLEVAIGKAYAGNYLSDLCKSVEICANGFGYTVVREMVGHGVGRELHEEPQVPNFWDRIVMGRGPKLAPGMVLAVEPMINAGVAEIDTLDDKWTVVTKDRKLSAHFEHMVLITDAEPEILSPRPRLIARKETGAVNALSN